MALRVAVVGSRGYADLARVRRFVAALAARHPGAVVLSGAAAGVDAAAAAAARAAGLAVEELPAAWERFGRGAGPRRNAELVAACDVVVAFWDGSSAGTRHTISAARAAAKPVFVYGPDGRLQEGGDAQPRQHSLW